MNLRRFLPLALLLPTGLLAVGTSFFPQSVASGDATQDSVILWTRAVDPANPGVDQPVEVSIYDTGTFSDIGDPTPLSATPVQTIATTALAIHDNCIKVRVTGLDAGRTYLFQWRNTALNEFSAVGRTKTAPQSGVEVKFAVFNCNDYVGRYYNTIRHVVDQGANEIDFIVHLGDYIYETDGDPSFQSVNGRRPNFPDKPSAIQTTSSGTLAANTVDQYRELYKVYREDPNLLRAHELFPFYVVWDDHEFSDDNWQDNATFFDGAVDEQQTTRKQNAEQVWYEFVPSGLGLNPAGDQFDINAGNVFPNTRIFRAFNFGPNLELILTDNRTNRPDHIIPEDAFPATIPMDEAVTSATVNTLQANPNAWLVLRSLFDPYFDVDTTAKTVVFPPVDPVNPIPLKLALNLIVQQASAAELAGPVSLGQVPARDPVTYAGDVVQGNLSGVYVNLLFAGAGLPAPFTDAELAAMDRGVSHYLLGKTSFFSDLGSRYQVVNEIYNIYAFYTGAAIPAAPPGADARDQSFYDLTQQGFLAAALSGSSAVWKVVGSSSPFTPIQLELGDVPPDVILPNSGTVTTNTGSFPLAQPIPAEFLVELLVNADEVIGFPVFRAGILDLLAFHDAVLVSGDIHASMMGTNFVPPLPGLKFPGQTVPDFTAPSISSSELRRAFASALTFIEGLISLEVRQTLLDPSAVFAFDEDQKEALLAKIDRVLEYNTPELQYMNTATQGYVVICANDSELIGEFREIRISNVGIDHDSISAEALDLMFSRKPWRVTKVAGDLVVEKLEETEAAIFARPVLAGQTVVVGPVPTEVGVEAVARYSIDLVNWNTVPVGDIVGVDGAEFDPVTGAIQGNGNEVAIFFRIPAAVSGEDVIFFRSE